MIGGMIMELKIKDPGSALTHFIAMLTAMVAATPLLIKAASVPGTMHLKALSVFIVSMILLYAASTVYHTFDISEHVNKILRKIDHMMISVLIAGSYTPICLLVLGGRTGLILLAIVWAFAIAGILGILSEMGFFRALYRHGLDLCPGIYTVTEFLKPGSFRMAAGRWYHLHRWRRDLCFEASNL